MDVLYPVYSTRDNVKFFGRLACSIRSLQKNTFKDFNICIVDTSPESLLPVINSYVGAKFKYLWHPKNNNIETQYGFFNKPYTINLGVQELVTSDMLMLSDVDIVYPPDYMQMMIDLFDETACDLVTPLCHKLDKEFYDSNHSYLIDLPGEASTGPGIPQ